MPNTFFGLNIGTLGIQAANVNLNVTANNIANEYTKGYSRQVAKQQATQALRVYQKYGMIGSGVEVVSIDRIRNEYYDKKYEENQTRLGSAQTTYYYMLKVEDLFNEATVDGFTKEYDNLFNSVEELIKDPSDITTRNVFLNYSESFLEYMQEIKNDLRLEQEDLNSEVVTNVNAINSLAQEIATLNKQINVVELSGAEANELRDRRTVLLDELSSIVSISTDEVAYDNGKTEFTVRVGSNILVDNYNYFSLEAVTRESNANGNDAVGLYDIKWSYGQSFEPIKENVKGSLYSLLEIRDGNNNIETGNVYSYPIDYKGVPYYMNQIDDFLDKFTSTLNEIHEKGENLYGESASGTPLYVKSPNGVYTVNAAIKQDPKLMATSYDSSDGASQSDLVYDLLYTKNAEIYKGGTASDFLQALITEIGVDTRKANNKVESYTNMQTTIENQRQSVMGVDRDEEAMNLVKFQEAYNLSSHVISIMAEMYDRLITQTGV